MPLLRSSGWPTTSSPARIERVIAWMSRNSTGWVLRRRLHMHPAAPAANNSILRYWVFTNYLTSEHAQLNATLKSL